jgi:hypothetical protein
MTRCTVMSFRPAAKAAVLEPVARRTIAFTQRRSVRWVSALTTADDSRACA